MYREITPGSWIAQFVEAYWVFDNVSSKKSVKLVLPDGCTDIVYSHGHSGTVVGCMTQARETDMHPGQQFIGIRFKPGTAAAFLPAAMKELRDRTYALEEMLKPGLHGLDGQELFIPGAVIPEILDNRLKEMFRLDKYKETSVYAVAMINNSQGKMSVADIASSLGVSLRQLERLFLETVGVSPKTYAGIVRFQKARSLLMSRPALSLASLALDTGYYDQAHFCREYKRYSSRTPMQE